MPIKVKPYTLPRAGVDVVEINIEEEYNVEGIGRDVVDLKGTLIAERTVPLLEHGKKKVDWKNSIIVARFTKLSLRGRSKVFGPVSVELDQSIPSFGVVQAGKCRAAMAITVSMPDHGLQLRGEEPIQLHSTVKTVPPIGDERTESVLPVKLIDTKTKRSVGTITKARVSWRELTKQSVTLAKDRA